MKRIVGLIFGIMLTPLLLVAPASAASPQTSMAVAGNPACAQSLLTFPVWYRGLTVANNDCTLRINAPNFVWVIVLNVSEILLQVVAYVAAIYILVGGYRYLTSAGEADRIANAKKTITSAIIGLLIGLFSVGIVNFIVGQIT